MAATVKRFTKDAYAKYLLENHDRFFHLLHCVTAAGYAATKKLVVKNAANDVCVLPAGIANLTRRVIPLSLQARQHLPGIPTVHYDPRSLTIIGGAAIEAYDASYPMDEYYRQTADIDAVWWPTITLPRDFKTQLEAPSTEYVNTENEKYKYIYQTANNSDLAEEGPHIPFRYAYRYGQRNDSSYVNTASKNIIAHAANFAVLSSSKAIQVLCQQYVSELQKQLSTFIATRDAELKQIALEGFGKKVVLIEARVRMSNLFVAGVCNVWGYLLLHSEDGSVNTIKLIEVAIHDGASSQKSNTIEPAGSDFIYSRYQEKDALTKPHPIQYQLRDGTTYEASIPIIQRLLDQQLKALEGRLESDDKITTHMMRSKFLHYIMRNEDPALAEEYKRIFISLCEKHDKLKRLCWKPAAPTAAPVPVALTAAPTAPPDYPPSYIPATAYAHSLQPIPPPTAAPRPPPTPRPKSYLETVARTAPAPTPKTRGPLLTWIFKGTTGAGEEIFELVDSRTGQVMRRNYRAPTGPPPTRRRGGKTRRRRTKQSRSHQD